MGGKRDLKPGLEIGPDPYRITLVRKLQGERWLVRWAKPIDDDDKTEWLVASSRLRVMRSHESNARVEVRS